jgi:Sec-independent protein translocase protein TatA
VISLSPVKLLVIAAVIMLLLGPDNFSEIAHRLGSSWRALKRLQERMENEVREAIPDLPSTSQIARIVRSPVSLLNQLSDRVDAKETADAAAASPSSEVPPEELAPPPLTSPPLPNSPRADDPSPPFDPSLN